MSPAKIKMVILKLAKEVWPKVTLYALLAAFTALGAFVLRHYFPLDSQVDKISVETVANILNILASSMLAVTTFSLSIMVSAYTAATSVSPRATQLVMQDQTTKNVLSTFLGSFIFSLVGLILINLGVYEGNGRFILFVMTLVVIVLIVATLIRWINRLGKLGRVGETTRMVEKVTLTAVENWSEKPFRGGRPLIENEAYAAGTETVHPDKVGYIQLIDVKQLAEAGREHDLDIFILCRPGAYVTPSEEILRYRAAGEFGQPQLLLEAVMIEDERTFEEDPRFGFCVLAEIASRALSPAVNDAGTAIDVIGRMVRIMDTLTEKLDSEPEVQFERVWVQPIDIGDMFEDAFNPIMRDGAAIYEVQCRLQKAFHSLSESKSIEVRRWAAIFSDRALARAEKNGSLMDEELNRLRKMTLKNNSNLQIRGD